MSAQESLAKIPIAISPKKGDGLAWKRRAVQIGFIIALILIPILGIFRIDLSSGFIVLGRQIWFADFLIVFGFWLFIASSFITLYSTVGTAFCGWACPQNSFSSLADRITSKLLGKRAVINWETKGSSKIAVHKNKWLNWFVLSMSILVIAMIFSIIPLLYFVEPKDAWEFFTFQSSTENAYSLRWIYMVFVFIAFVNFAVVRHFMCRFMCIYRMWQFLFKTNQTLHIEYDESRSSECEKCNYCASHCMVEIDPRKTNIFDSCTNCGACITACNTIHQKKDQPGLLKFKLGERRVRFTSNSLKRLASFRERLAWVMPFWALGGLIFAWGLWTYDEIHFAVYKSELFQQKQISEYRIHIANKLDKSEVVRLEIDGLRQDQFHLSATDVPLDPLSRADVTVKLNDSLPPGVHGFIVRASTENGWQGFTRIQHIVTRSETL